MEESVFFPSPNWYLTSVLETTIDGWLIYGSPAKGICVLSPINPSGLIATQSFKVRTIQNAHKERVLDVSISPSWLSSRLFVTSSEDGFVKQWNADDLSLLLAHNVHSTNKEPVAGLTYCDDNTVVSAGRDGSIVVWDVQVNVTSNLTVLLKGLKPNCLSTSPHDPTIVAIGTKQGVVLVCSIKDGGRMMYKVRGHDSEILKVCWCPCPISYIEKANNKRIESSKSKKQEDESESNGDEKILRKLVARSKTFTVSNRLEIAKDEDASQIPQSEKDTAEGSDDSSDSIVQEEDLFDVYQDPVDQEFGHTKFKSEEIVIAEEKSKIQSDFLEECQRLKQDLLARKDEDRLANADVDELSNQLQSTILDPESTVAISSHNEDTKVTENWRSGQGCEPGVKQYKHVLASCCKSGKVCLWSMGKQVGFASPPGHQPAGNAARRNKMSWCAMHWISADTLLVSDAMHRLLEYKTNKVGRSNQFSWQVLHEEHRRGLFCISSNAPRVQTVDEDQESRTVWTLAQDRFLVSYAYPEKKVLAKYPTFGGFVYHITSSPIDPTKFAICVGDGSVKVWEIELDFSNKLVVGGVQQHWQNIQGKVLYAAWHPTKENLLAYGTMEGRIGLLDTSGKQERAARLLYPAMAKGVYSLSWGDHDQLFACGGHQLYRYNTKLPNAEPDIVSVNYDNKEWKVTDVSWTSRYLTVGNSDGDVALLNTTAPHRLLAAAFVFRKSIQCISWHPSGVSSAEGASPHINWLAVSCADTDIALLNVVENPNPTDGDIRLELVRTFVGHSDNVSKLAWSPHHEARLLSVAMDGVAQVWDAVSGTVMSSFTCHTSGVLAGAWWPEVERADVLLTAGSDYCIRMWDTNSHPPSQLPLLTKTQRKRAKTAKPRSKNDGLLAKSNGNIGSTNQNKKDQKPTEELDSDTEVKMATVKGDSKVSKKYIMTITSKQQNRLPGNGCRVLLHQYMLNNNLAVEEDGAELDLLYDVDYLKLFGTKEHVLKLIEMEQERHLETLCLDGWIALTLLIGEIESALKFAASRHILTPFLLSLAPSVSHRFWKEMMAAYVVQVGKTEELGQNHGTSFLGGGVVRAALVQLCLGATQDAVDTLQQAGLWREALVVMRVRGLSHTDLLTNWGADLVRHGQLLDAALIYIAQEDFNNAITVLRKSKDQTHTDLAVKIAKLTGQHIYAQTLLQTIKQE